jgi:transcriptional regulator with XRE-family HTH domain
MSNKPPTQPLGPAINRIADVMAHTPFYQFKGTGRIAADARLDSSTVSRLIHGKINPSFILVARITAALEQRLGFKIDPRDLVSENGEFLTNYVCDLVACRGCLPENALDEFGDRKAAFINIQQGKWVTSRYPGGYKSLKGEL